MSIWEDFFHAKKANEIDILTNYLQPSNIVKLHNCDYFKTRSHVFNSHGLLSTYSGARQCAK